MTRQRVTDMNERLTADELREIKRRCAAARPGPWISFVEGRDHESGSDFIRVGMDDDDDDIEPIGATVEDQDFIAHARQDVPKLIEEIEHLWRELGRLGA